MTFFLLAARSIGATPRMLLRIWTFRLLIDVFVVGSVLLFPDWLLVLLRPLNSLTQHLHYLIGQ